MSTYFLNVLPKNIISQRNEMQKIDSSKSRIFPPHPWIASPTKRGTTGSFLSLTNQHPSHYDCGNAGVSSISRSNFKDLAGATIDQ